MLIMILFSHTCHGKDDEDEDENEDDDDDDEDDDEDDCPPPRASVFFSFDVATKFDLVSSHGKKEVTTTTSEL